MDKFLDFNNYYVCPDCREEVQGYELQTWNKEVPYVCPSCGCIQNIKEVERQLRKKD